MVAKRYWSQKGKGNCGGVGRWVFGEETVVDLYSNAYLTPHLFSAFFEMKFGDPKCLICEYHHVLIPLRLNRIEQKVKLPPELVEKFK